MNEYELLLQCYRSGQVSERSWQLHLQDEGLKKYLNEKITWAVRQSEKIIRREDE